MTSISKRAKVTDNLPDDNGCSLCVATKNGDMPTLINLVETGHDVNERDKQYLNKTPLMYAVEKGDTDLVTFLLQHGADVSLEDLWGNNVVMTASGLGHLDTLRLLLQHGAPLDCLGVWSGLTALMLAVKAEHRDCVKLLLDYGADPTVRSLEGHTARDVALQQPASGPRGSVWGEVTRSHKQVEILSLLEQHKTAVSSLYHLVIHAVTSCVQAATLSNKSAKPRTVQDNIQKLPLPKRIKRHLCKHAHTIATHNGLDDYNSDSDSDYNADPNYHSDSDFDPNPPLLSDSELSSFSDTDSDSDLS